LQFFKSRRIKKAPTVITHPLGSVISHGWL
jgi:hypothetical protein